MVPLPPNPSLHPPSSPLSSPPAAPQDEPTSGLDSTTALNLIHTLRTLASGGRTIIASIHQPSSRLFSQMDKVGAGGPQLGAKGLMSDFHQLPSSHSGWSA